MKTKESVNDDIKRKDKTADDWKDIIGMFKKLSQNDQTVILELIRTILHNV